MIVGAQVGTAVEMELFTTIRAVPAEVPVTYDLIVHSHHVFWLLVVEAVPPKATSLGMARLIMAAMAGASLVAL